MSVSPTTPALLRLNAATACRPFVANQVGLASGKRTANRYRAASLVFLLHPERTQALCLLYVQADVQYSLDAVGDAGQPSVQFHRKSKRTVEQCLTQAGLTKHVLAGHGVLEEDD